MRWIWSESVDVAYHYALAARLAEFWSLPPTVDHAFNYYPRLSHTLAALVGVVFGSPLIGLEIVALVSLIVLWSAIVYLLWSLPHTWAAASSAVFIVCLLLNRKLIHAELFGNEIIINFFFPQLVAQALAFLAIVIVLYAEQWGAKPFIRYLVLSAFVLIAAKTHLVPALVLLGLLTGLVILEAALENWPTNAFGAAANAAVGLLLIVITSALVVADPSFKHMKYLANWNGYLALTHISSMRDLAWICLVVVVGSAAILFKWKLLNGSAERTTLAVMKYLGLYGISAAGLCLLQQVLLKLGHGSEYAAKKYAFNLNTVVLLEIALLPLLLISRDSDSISESSRNLCSFFAPFGLIVASLLCIAPSLHMINTAKVVSLERQLRSLRDTAIPRNPGKYNYAVNLQDLSPSTNFLLTLGALNVPYYDPNGMDELFGRQFSDFSSIGTIVTSEGRKPYDLEACRRFVSTSGLALLDGSCVGKSLENLSCQRVNDFTDWVNPRSLQGFSEKEAFGRWTDGARASFMCTLPEGQQGRPTSVKIVTQGFVFGNHSQRAVISINGAAPKEYRYSADQAEQVIELPLPHDSTQEIHISFFLPDAVSPRSLGMNSDSRNIGISVRSIEFK